MNIYKFNGMIPIDVTLVKIVTFLSLMQDLNAKLPMDIILDGILMDVRLLL